MEGFYEEVVPHAGGAVQSKLSPWIGDTTERTMQQMQQNNQFRKKFLLFTTSEASSVSESYHSIWSICIHCVELCRPCGTGIHEGQGDTVSIN